MLLAAEPRPPAAPPPNARRADSARPPIIPAAAAAVEHRRDSVASSLASGGARTVGSWHSPCPICWVSPMLRPVTTVCGHEFCKGCIAKTRDAGHQACPLCRADLGETVPVESTRRRGSAASLASSIATFGIWGGGGGMGSSRRPSLAAAVPWVPPCAICLRSPVLDAVAGVGCSHQFCRGCMAGHTAAGHSDCPLCRVPLDGSGGGSQTARAGGLAAARRAGRSGAVVGLLTDRLNRPTESSHAGQDARIQYTRSVRETRRQAGVLRRAAAEEAQAARPRWLPRALLRERHAVAQRQVSGPVVTFRRGEDTGGMPVPVRVSMDGMSGVAGGRRAAESVGNAARFNFTVGSRLVRRDCPLIDSAGFASCWMWSAVVSVDPIDYDQAPAQSWRRDADGTRHLHMEPRLRSGANALRIRDYIKSVSFKDMTAGTAGWKVQRAVRPTARDTFESHWVHWGRRPQGTYTAPLTNGEGSPARGGGSSGDEDARREAGSFSLAAGMISPRLKPSHEMLEQSERYRPGNCPVGHGDDMMVRSALTDHPIEVTVEWMPMVSRPPTRLITTLRSPPPLTLPRLVSAENSGIAATSEPAADQALERYEIVLAVLNAPSVAMRRIRSSDEETSPRVGPPHWHDPFPHSHTDLEPELEPEPLWQAASTYLAPTHESTEITADSTILANGDGSLEPCSLVSPVAALELSIALTPRTAARTAAHGLAAAAIAASDLALTRMLQRGVGMLQPQPPTSQPSPRRAATAGSPRLARLFRNTEAEGDDNVEEEDSPRDSGRLRRLRRQLSRQSDDDLAAETSLLEIRIASSEVV